MDQAWQQSLKLPEFWQQRLVIELVKLKNETIILKNICNNQAIAPLTNFWPAEKLMNTKETAVYALYFKFAVIYFIVIFQLFNLSMLKGEK